MCQLGSPIFTLHFLLPQMVDGQIHHNLYNIVGNDINAMMTEVYQTYCEAVIPEWGLWVTTEAGQYKLSEGYIRNYKERMR